MFCTNCRAELAHGASFCPGCGSKVKSAFATVDNESIGWAWGFACMFPLVGFIMFFVWMGDKPKKSKQAILCAFLGMFFIASGKVNGG